MHATWPLQTKLRQHVLQDDNSSCGGSSHQCVSPADHAMRLLDRVLTPRGKPGGQADTTCPAVDPHNAPSTVNGASSTPQRIKPLSLGKLVSAAGRMLTPRGRKKGVSASGAAADAAGSPASSSPRIPAIRLELLPQEQGQQEEVQQKDQDPYTPKLTALMEQQLQLPLGLTASSGGASSTRRQLTTLPTDSDGDGDGASEAGSEASSLDGFGEYARRLGSPEEAAAAEGGEGGSPAAAAEPDPDKLPSPRTLVASVQLCTPRPSARDAERGSEDLEHFVQMGELPGSRGRIARMLLHADGVGVKALAGLSLQELGYERCVALLHQLLLPLPLNERSGALVYLRSKLSTQLMTSLGAQLERVLESERACQRFCHLPFECASWLLEHAPVDRGETLFDLANLWLEQKALPPLVDEQRALAVLVWRRPLAADFLRCMAANLPWAAQHVATCGLRPARLPPSLDGKFSFTAEFELHDLLEMQQASLADGRPRQRQALATYCGGYCWWAVVAANPQRNRFELYASCSPYSLFQDQYRSSLQPAADVRFSFQGTTSLADWQQTNAERVAAMHTHWGGPAFWVPSGCPSLRVSSTRQPGSGSRSSGSSTGGSLGLAALPGRRMAAEPRPDTARGPRPSSTSGRRAMASRQPSRLSISSSASGEQQLALGRSSSSGSGSGSVGLSGLPSGSSLVSAASATSAAVEAGASLQPTNGSTGSGDLASMCPSEGSGSGMLAEGRLEATEEGGQAEAALQLHHLSMDQLVAEVRRSCPYSWGAALRVRVHLKLLGTSK